MQHLLRPKHNYYVQWYHAVECLGFSDHFIGAFTSDQVEYNTFAKPTEATLRNLFYDLLRESSDWFFAAEYTEETIAGDLGEKLAAIRLHLHPNLAGLLATPDYVDILDRFSVQFCVMFLLEGMLLLRTTFVNTQLRARPFQALQTSTQELAKLFQYFDIRNRVTQGEREKVEYIVID
jgi:hypothetical protein